MTENCKTETLKFMLFSLFAFWHLSHVAVGNSKLFFVSIINTVCHSFKRSFNYGHYHHFHILWIFSSSLARLLYLLPLSGYNLPYKWYSRIFLLFPDAICANCAKYSQRKRSLIYEGRNKLCVQYLEAHTDWISEIYFFLKIMFCQMMNRYSCPHW